LDAEYRTRAADVRLPTAVGPRCAARHRAWTLFMLLASAAGAALAALPACVPTVAESEVCPCAMGSKCCDHRCVPASQACDDVDATDAAGAGDAANAADSAAEGSLSAVDATIEGDTPVDATATGDAPTPTPADAGATEAAASDATIADAQDREDAADATANVTPPDPAKWEPAPLSGNFTPPLISTIAVDSLRTPPAVVVGFSDGEIYEAPDALANPPAWTPIARPIDGGPSPLPGVTVTALAFDGQGGLFAAFVGTTQGPHVFRTANGGQTWKQLVNEPIDEVWGLSMNPQTAIMYAVGDNGEVATTTDLGDTWSTDPPAGDPLTAPMDAGARVTSVAAIGNNVFSLIVASSNGRVYENANTMMPAQWRDITNAMMPARVVTRVTASLESPPSFYVTYQYEAFDSVWGCIDGGWSNLTHSQLPTTPSVSSYGFFGVSVHPIVPDALFVNGTGGVGGSLDRGATWTWTAL
jgi:photosystem II stability/assembly factor-like uncharacterized protein